MHVCMARSVGMRGMRHIKGRAAAPTPQLRGPRYAPPYDFSPKSWLALGLGLGLVLGG